MNIALEEKKENNREEVKNEKFAKENIYAESKRKLNDDDKIEDDNSEKKNIKSSCDLNLFSEIKLTSTINDHEHISNSFASETGESKPKVIISEECNDVDKERI